MDKKQYKIKYENGTINPLEPINIEGAKEGYVVFLESDSDLYLSKEKPIWETIDEIVKDVPEEEFDKFPRDGAHQHDHYIYGTPKKNQ